MGRNGGQEGRGSGAPAMWGPPPSLLVWVSVRRGACRACALPLYTLSSRHSGQTGCGSKTWLLPATVRRVRRGGWLGGIHQSPVPCSLHPHCAGLRPRLCGCGCISLPASSSQRTGRRPRLSWLLSMGAWGWGWPGACPEQTSLSQG